MHLKVEVRHEADEKIGILGHGLDAGAQEGNKVLPVLKAVIILSN